MQIEGVLRQEIAAVERFVDRLGAEQVQLKSGVAETLSEIAAEKAAIIEQLGQLATARNRLLAQAGLGSDGDGLTQWAKAHGGERAALHKQLVGLAAEAKELNRLNGYLIALRLNHTQAALAALSPERANSLLYDRDGQTTGRTGYRLIDSA